MEFIDSTGHIFSLEEYSSYPEGYEFIEHQYVFWMENEYNSKLSVDCFYIKPIRILVSGKLTNKDKIHISISKSSHYKLLSSSKIQELIESDVNFFSDNKYLTLDENEHFCMDLYNYANEHEEKQDLLLINNLVKDVYYRIDEDNNEYIYYGKVIEEHNTDGSIKYFAPFFTYVYNDETIIVEYSENIHQHEDGTYSINIENEDIECIETKVELLRKNDINNDVFTLIPFYIVGNVKEEGAWLTNILININDDRYCPITVGGTYYDEIEELVINGKNMGIDLPKDIVRAFYNSNFYADTVDKNIWNSKIKEYLINYMKLRGETGNFRNILNTLKWFGYGDKISIYKLLKTDNNFIEQYVTDNFYITTDIIQSYKLFKNTTYITLSLPGVIATDELHTYDFNNDFWGEGNPKLQDLFDTYITKTIDETGIEYVKQYYDYSFNELGLKLSCLKYYFEKYFLPLHIKIFRSSITNQCFASDIKLLNTVSTHINSNSVFITDNNIIVNFPVQDTLWLSSQVHFIDNNFNEFSNYFNRQTSNDIYYLNDICFSIPIEFSSKIGEQFYNVHAILYRNDEEILETSFNFCNNISFTYDNKTLTNLKDVHTKLDMSSNKTKYFTITNINDVETTVEINRIDNHNSDFKSIVIYPKLLAETYNTYDWLNSTYYLVLLVNNTWHKYEFKLKMPELNINVGKLEYQYNYKLHKQFNGVKDNILQFNASIYSPDIVTINNSSFIENLVEYMKYNCLDYVSDEYNILRDNIYYYYYNSNGYKCIYNITYNDKNELTSCNILTNDPSYQKQESEVLKSDNIYKLYDILPYDELDIYQSEREELFNNLYNKKCFMSVSKNIISFIDLYTNKYNLSNNISNILNRVHMFNIIEISNDGDKHLLKYVPSGTERILSLKIEFEQTYKTLVFGDNDSENIVNLYSNFFNVNNGYWNDTLLYSQEGKWVEDKYLHNNYDFYLMHDDEYWYGIMISKLPIEHGEKLYVPKKLYKSISNNNETNNTYYLEYISSDNKLLINRLKYIDANGKNKFKNNDIVVCRVENLNTPFNLTLGSKWNIKPISIGIENYSNISSNTNMGIISIGDNLKYESGFYEIQVNYSLDNRNINSEKRTTKILIE